MIKLLNPEDINILVIGDIMLDIYNYGDAHRISPEAPVPVFHSKERKYYLGGAANTYANLCNIKVKAHLFGSVGEDHNGYYIRDEIEHLSSWNSFNCIIEQHSIPTITKERIVARSQQIVRVDVEEITPLNRSQINKVIDKYEKLNDIIKLDAIIISDYGKGFICTDLMEAFRHDPSFFNTDVYIDPYPKHKEMYANSYCITPNQKEFDEMGGVLYLMMEQKISNVIRTEGENGITVFPKNGGTYHIDTEAQTVYDVSGAGDTVVAVLAATRSMGFTLEDSVILANSAAGNVVSQMGTTAVNSEFIKKRIKEMGNASNYV